MFPFAIGSFPLEVLQYLLFSVHLPRPRHPRQAEAVGSVEGEDPWHHRPRRILWL